MKILLISGWGTTCGIWNRVSFSGFEKQCISWDRVLTGDFQMPDRCVAAGWSLGGQIALDLSRRPEVEGLVLISSMTCIASTGIRPGIEPERCSMISRMLTRSRRGYLRSFFLECGATEEELIPLLEDSDVFTTEELISGLSVMFNHLAVPDPSVPAVIIHGTEDRIIPHEVSGYLARVVLKNAREIPVEGGGHLLPLHVPELIGKAVKDLAESLLA